MWVMIEAKNGTRLHSHDSNIASLELPTSVPYRGKDDQSRREFINDLGILNNATDLGKSYYEVTGNLPTFENFEALRANGYCEFSPSELERIFGTWDEFQAEVGIQYGLDQQERANKKQEMLEIIELDRQAGVLHPQLFKRTVRAKTVQQKKTDNGGRQRWNLRFFINMEVDDDEKIHRYVRFKIAEKLTQNLERTDIPLNRSPDPLVRRTNIALGFNVESGALLSSFKAEIMKSNIFISSDEIDKLIEDIAEDHEWLDYYVEPETRRRDLRKLQKAAEHIEGSSILKRRSYDTQKAKLLGSPAVNSFTKPTAKIKI